MGEQIYIFNGDQYVIVIKVKTKTKTQKKINKENNDGKYATAFGQIMHRKISHELKLSHAISRLLWTATTTATNNKYVLYGKKYTNTFILYSFVLLLNGLQ